MKVGSVLLYGAIVGTLFVAGPATAQPPPVSFIAAPTYAVGSSLGPIANAVGDFNGDGIPDLAVVDDYVQFPGQGKIAILLGTGDGSFQTPRDYLVEYGSTSLAVGDFNGDGHLDIVTSMGSILYGNGDGTFQAAQSIGIQGRFVVAGDFNRDGKLDLAMVTYDPDHLGQEVMSILLGNGDGTFQDFSTNDAGQRISWLGVADFNSDGIPDLVVANGPFDELFDTQVSVALGRGDGTFGTFYSFPAPVASSLAVGDFNGDGHPDIVTDWGSILFGNGDGTFQAAQNGGPRRSPMAVGDFNGDGTPDLAVANYYPISVSILLGRGDGTLQDTSVSYATAGTVSSLVVADLNGDGHADLIVIADGRLQGGSGAVSIFMNNGDGTLRAAPAFPDFAAGSAGVVAADFNGDGKLDLATTIGTVFPGKGDGTFQPVQLEGAVGACIVVGDFNGDGHADLATNNYGSSTVNILLGKGDDAFERVQTYAIGPADPGPFALAVGDLNGDGHLDIAAADSSHVRILLGNGDGSFRIAASYVVKAGSLAIGDFNRDGKLDIATSSGSLLLGNGDGTLRVAQNYANPGANTVAVGDFNGDGIPDLALAFGSYPDYEGTVSILLGNGDGTFRAAQRYAVGLQPVSLAVGDLNRDGVLDLAVANKVSNTVSVLLGSGDGTLQPALNYAAGSYPVSVAVGDFNGDGYLDLAVDGFSPGTLTVLMNAGR